MRCQERQYLNYIICSMIPSESFIKSTLHLLLDLIKKERKKKRNNYNKKPHSFLITAGSFSSITQKGVQEKQPPPPSIQYTTLYYVCV